MNSNDIKLRIAQFATCVIVIIACSAIPSHASQSSSGLIARGKLFGFHHGHANLGAVQFASHNTFDVAIDAAGAAHSLANSSVQSIGILLPEYYLDLLEFLGASPFDAGGSISHATAVVALGVATMDCALVDPQTPVINEHYSVDLSECSASYYLIPPTRAASKFVFGDVFESTASIRDSSVVGRAILAATTFAGGATTVSVGAWASQHGAWRAPRFIVARALTGGTGAYRGVTGQENVKLLVRRRTRICLQFQ